MGKVLMAMGGGGVSLEPVTAAPADVRGGKTFYGSGSEDPQAGTLTDNQAWNGTVGRNASVNVPDGIHKGSSVAGPVMTDVGAKSITPTESVQTAVGPGCYTTGAVTVGAIPATYIGSGVDRIPGKTVIPSGSVQKAILAGQYASGDIDVAAIPDDYIRPGSTASFFKNGGKCSPGYDSSSVTFAAVRGFAEYSLGNTYTLNSYDDTAGLTRPGIISRPLLLRYVSSVIANVDNTTDDGTEVRTGYSVMITGWDDGDTTFRYKVMIPSSTTSSRLIFTSGTDCTIDLDASYSSLGNASIRSKLNGAKYIGIIFTSQGGDRDRFSISIKVNRADAVMRAA